MWWELEDEPVDKSLGHCIELCSWTNHHDRGAHHCPYHNPDDNDHNEHNSITFPNSSTAIGPWFIHSAL